MDFHWVKSLKKLYRTPVEFQELSQSKDRLMKFGLLTACFAATIACFLYFLAPQAKSWVVNSVPNVPIPFGHWKVLYGKFETENCASNLKCPANPKADALWKDAIRREAPEHVTSRRDETKGEMWFKAEIAKDYLFQAKVKKADTLALGWFRGKYKVWVNGRKHFESDFRNSNPITIALDERIFNEKSLTIHVFLEKTPRHHFADVMNIGQMTGFYDAHNLEAYYGFHSFWARVRPFAYFLLNLLIGLFFFTVWTYFPTKPEHFYLSLFALTNALSQIRLMDFVFLNLDYETLFKFSFLTRCFIGASATLLGAAIGRMRESIMRGAAVVLFGAPIVAAVFFLNSRNGREFEVFGFAIFIPVCLALGALAVLSQLITLVKRFGYKKLVKPRMRTLVFSFWGLLWLAFLYRNNPNLESTTLRTEYSLLTHMAAHVGIVISWALMLLQEMKKQALLVEKTPVSEYHKRPVLPESINGVILTVDMKNSEALFRLTGGDSSGENWVGLWRSHAYLSIAEHNGVILQKKGDEIQIFFDAERHPSVELVGLKAFEDLVALSRKLEMTIPSNDYIKPQEFRLRLRGSLVLGSIKPIWENMGKGASEPYWEQSSGSQVFVDAARLLDAEKTLVPDKTVNALVMTKEFATTLRSNATLNGTWLTSMKISVKSSPLYDVTAYLPNLGEADPKKENRNAG